MSVARPILVINSGCRGGAPVGRGVDPLGFRLPARVFTFPRALRCERIASYPSGRSGRERSHRIRPATSERTIRTRANAPHPTGHIRADDHDASERTASDPATSERTITTRANAPHPTGHMRADGRGASDLYLPFGAPTHRFR